jgi:protein-disulfide isomerase
MAQKFAAQNNVAWPFVVDPQGKFAAMIKADYALGQQVGIEHTPTIWVVMKSNSSAPPFVEVLDRGKLYTMIEDAIRQAGGIKDAAPAAARKPVKKAQ